MKKAKLFSKPGFSSMWTVNFQMFKLYLEKAEEPEIKLSTSVGSSEKQESSRKTSAATAAKSLQSCLTLCDLRDGSPPGSPIPGILQVRTLEWVAIAFSARKTSTFALLNYAKAFACVDHNQLWKILREMNTRPPDLPPEKSVCRSRSNS